MASADFCMGFPAPLDVGSTEVPLGTLADLPGYDAPTFTLMPVGYTSRRSVQVSGFADICLLTPPCRLISASCSSGQRFAFSFLQISSRPEHPCRSANSSPCRASRGLPPPSECALPGAQKERAPAGSAQKERRREQCKEKKWHGGLASHRRRRKPSGAMSRRIAACATLRLTASTPDQGIASGVPATARKKYFLDSEACLSAGAYPTACTCTLSMHGRPEEVRTRAWAVRQAAGVREVRVRPGSGRACRPAGSRSAA